jgi:cyclin T
MTTQNNWLFTNEELESLPSIKDGFTKQQELEYRRITCAFIQECGIALKIPQLAIATASVFFHRFYVLHSFKAQDRLLVATTCVFLAGKVEETPKKLQDVLITSDKLIRKQDAQVKPLVPDSPEYNDFKERVLQMERILLQTLGFDLKVEHPYKPLLHFVKDIKGQKDLAQVAWNFANDSLRTTLCLQYQPKHIAAAAVCLACKFIKFTMPDKWWETFGTSVSDVENISNQILDLYEGSEKAKSLKEGSSTTTNPPAAQQSTDTSSSSTSTSKPSPPKKPAFLPFDTNTK